MASLVKEPADDRRCSICLKSEEDHDEGVGKTYIDHAYTQESQEVDR